MLRRSSGLIPAEVKFWPFSVHCPYIKTSRPFISGTLLVSEGVSVAVALDISPISEIVFREEVLLVHSLYPRESPYYDGWWTARPLHTVWCAYILRRRPTFRGVEGSMRLSKSTNSNTTVVRAT